MTTTGRVVSQNVKALMALTGTTGKAVGEALDKDKSTVSRKLKTGAWTVEDLDRLGELWGVGPDRFFVDPTSHFGVVIPNSGCLTGVSSDQLVLNLAAA